MELNFDSFINVVNALGGIKMYFPEPVFDAYSGLNIQTTGCIQLNGTQALQVVRARHVQYKGPGVTTDDPNYWPQEAQSDIARIRRDHEFLRVLATAVKQKGLSNPLTDQQLVAGVVGQLTVDSGFSATAMISMVLDYHSVDVNTAPQLTLPVAVDQFGDYTYQGGSYGDIEFPAEPQDHQAVDEFLGLSSSDDDTYSGGALPAPSAVTVSVLNGSGAYNQATDTAQSLQTLGFKIGTIGDSPPVGQEAETVVYYSSKAPAELAAAQAVANSLSGAVIMADDASQVSPGSAGHRCDRHRVQRQPAGTAAGQHHFDHLGPPQRVGPFGRDDHHDDNQPLVGQHGQHGQQRLRVTDALGRAPGPVGPPRLHGQWRRGDLSRIR